ncbi:MAG: polymerase sigma-70 factor, subfamily [Gaiellaceae bacterium]|nr:polymerase sigma-70 factor, subfamily [Gaiellaceae bacterium]
MRARRQPLLDGAAALRVRRVLYLNGLRGEEIEDAMQEIELRALERPPRDVSSATSWACVVATNLAMDVHRRMGRDDVLESWDAPSPDPTEPTGLRDAMRTGLAALTADLRATIVLRFYADFTVPEIATAMAVPEGTVKSRLHRAIEELRQHLPMEALR